MCFLSPSSFPLYVYPLSISNKSFFYSTVFFKSKLDYFDRRNLVWWRYKPGAGIEFGEIINTKKDKDGRLGLAFNAGLDRQFDFLPKEQKDNGWVPMLSAKIMLGSHDSFNKK